MRISDWSSDVCSSDLLAFTRSTSLGDANQLSTAFATERLISLSLLAYRLFRGGRSSENMWKVLAATFRTEWLQNRAAQRERARGQDGGPNYYIVRRHRLGAALLNFVARNMSEGVLTPTRASKLLGVKPRSVHPLLSGAALPLEQGA